MDIKEIRIGNWLTVHQPFQVWAINGDGILMSAKNHAGYNIEYTKGILLTDAYLIKLGFEWDEFTWCKRDINIFLSGVNRQGSYTIFHKNVSRVLLDINYIHELQNIVYDLEGKELTINL